MQKRTLLLISTFLLTALISSASIFAASPSKSLGFQGQLFNNGTPLTSSVNATFTFYDALSGGAVTGSPIAKTITVNNGYFGTSFTESDTAGVNFDQALYVQVNINGTDLSPRTSLNAAPTALKSFGTFSYASAPTVGPAGSLYFNTTDNTLYTSNGTSWTASTPWVTNGSNISYMGGNVGIGSSTPGFPLTITGAGYASTGFVTGNGTTNVGGFTVNISTTSRVSLARGYDFGVISSSMGLLYANGPTALGIFTENVPTYIGHNSFGVQAFNIPITGCSLLCNPYYSIPTNVVMDSNAPLITNNIIGGSFNGSSAPGTAGTYGALSLRGGNGSGSNVAGSLLNLVGGQSTGSADGGAIRFLTTPASTSSATINATVERMRIDANGNIGIGTSTPLAKLSINANPADTIATLFLVSSSTASVTNNLFSVSNTGVVTINRSGFNNPVLAPSSELQSGLNIFGVTPQQNTISMYAAGGPTNNTIVGYSSPGPANAPTATQADIVLMRMMGGGHTGVAYTSKGQVGIWASENWSATSTGADIRFETTANGGTTRNEKMRIANNGFLGIGTTTPTAQLSNTGTVRFASLVGGGANLVVDSLGNVTVSSDERLKDIQGEFKTGLEKILGLNPIMYKWKPETGYDTTNAYAGFSAQNVQENIPEAVGTDGRGFLTLADRPILAALVNAVKEIATKIEGFATSFTSKHIETDELCINKKNGTKVCVDADALEQMMAERAAQNTYLQTPPPTAPEETVSTSTPEVIPEPETPPVTEPDVPPAETPVQQ
ncbi:MAG: tail fiber domain-containing protein [Patescibacteria group bacterium]